MKRVLACLTAALLVLGITACGGAPEEKQPQDDSQPEKVTITYLSRYTSPEVPRHKYYLDKLEEFRAQNPDIIVEDISISDADSYKSSLRSAVATGTLPTVYICSDAFPHLDWAKNGVMQDLTSLIEAENWTGPTDPDIFSSFSFPRDGLDGIYGIPNAVVNSPVYVNTKLLKEYNLETPETWEDVLVMAETLRAADPTIIPFCLPAKSSADLGRFFSELVVRMYGLEFRDKVIAHEVKWTDPELTNALKVFQEYIDLGVFGPDAITSDTEPGIAAFGEGRVAMLFAASYFWDRFNSFDFADEINCVNFPYFQDAPENKDIWFATTSEGFCVSAKPGTPEYDAAGRLLNFMLGAETLSGYANEIAKGGIYPLEVDFDMSLASTPMRTFMDGYAGRSGITDNITAYMNNSNVMGVTNTELQGLFVGQSYETVAQSLQNQYDEIFGG